MAASPLDTRTIELLDATEVRATAEPADDEVSATTLRLAAP